MYFFQMSEEYKFVSSVLDYVSLHCGSVGKSSSNSPRLKSGLFKRSLDFFRLLPRQIKRTLPLLTGKSSIMKHKIWHKRRIFTTVLAVLLLISLLSVGLWQLVLSQTTTEAGDEETNPGIVSRTMLTQL